MEIITNSPHETEELGKKVGTHLKGGEIIALKGEMGAGKTAFVKGIAKGLGIKANITSPTFIIMRHYEIEGKDPLKALYHVDLYRLESNVHEEIQNLGVFDMWAKKENIFVIEWSERLSGLPEDAIEVEINETAENSRRFVIHHLKFETI